MNWPLFVLTIGLAAGYGTAHYIGVSLPHLLYCLQYLPKSHFYDLYEDCTTQALPISLPASENAAIRPVSLVRHKKAFDNFRPHAYEFFRHRQKSLLVFTAQTSALALVIPAVLFFHELWWLLFGYIIGLAVHIGYQVFIDGYEGPQQYLLVSVLTDIAYLHAGIKLRSKPVFVTETADAPSEAVQAESEAISEISIWYKPVRWRFGIWRTFCIFLLAIDVLSCGMLLSGFWLNDFHRLHYSIADGIITTIFAPLFLQLFFAIIFLPARFIVKRRRAKRAPAPLPDTTDVAN